MRYLIPVAALLFSPLAIADCAKELAELDKQTKDPAYQAELDSRYRELRQAALLLDENKEDRLCENVVDEMRTIFEEKKEIVEEKRREQALREANAVTSISGVIPTKALLDLDIRNTDDIELGTIVGIALDADTTSIAYLVIEHGGFLGFGKNYSAVPWNRLRQIKSSGEFLLKLSENELKKLPRFDEDEWPQSPVTSIQPANKPAQNQPAKATETN